MTPVRPPSLELLRALRRANRVLPRSHQPSSCLISRLPANTRRTLTTTSTLLNDVNPSRPKASPGLSATSAPRRETGQENPLNRYAPTTHDRGPTSKEDTQTDFGVMDIFANVPNPATSIDACTSDGFHLDNGLKITGYSGLLVAGGEAWSWRPWLALSSQTPNAEPKLSDLLDARRGILTIPKQSLGLFAILHPKLDLLIIGTGSKLWMLSPETKKYMMEELGLRVDVMDTGNASAAYNLLAKERGVEGGAGVGGIFLPIGWKGPEGAGRKR